MACANLTWWKILQEIALASNVFYSFYCCGSNVINIIYVFFVIFRWYFLNLSLINRQCDAT